MKKLIFLLLFLFAGSLFAQTYITVLLKSSGEQWTAAEQNQIIGALKDGTLAISVNSVRLISSVGSDTAYVRIIDGGANADTLVVEGTAALAFRWANGSVVVDKDTVWINGTRFEKNGGVNVVENNACIRLEDDSGNYSRIKTGNSQLSIEVDPDNAVASTDIVFKIDGVEVGRFEQGKGFQSKRGFATELWDVVGGHFETAVVNTEYYSPNQCGGIYGTIYRQYFNTVLTSTNPRLDTGNNVTGMIDYSIQFKYTGDDRGLGHGNATAYGSSDNHIYVMLGGASGAGNLVFAPTGYTIQRGWADYTK